MGTITLLILNREDYLQLENKEKYINNEFYQISIQLEMLRHNPYYVILGACINYYFNGDAAKRYIPYKSRHLLFDTFIRKMFDVILSYVEAGDITRSTYAYFIKASFEQSLYSCIEVMKSSHFAYRIDDDAMEILEKYYGKEPYYAELKRYIEDAIAKEIKD